MPPKLAVATGAKMMLPLRLPLRFMLARDMRDMMGAAMPRNERLRATYYAIRLRYYLTMHIFIIICALRRAAALL